MPMDWLGTRKHHAMPAVKPHLGNTSVGPVCQWFRWAESFMNIVPLVCCRMFPHIPGVACTEIPCVCSLKLSPAFLISCKHGVGYTDCTCALSDMPPHVQSQSSCTAVLQHALMLRLQVAPNQFLSIHTSNALQQGTSSNPSACIAVATKPAPACRELLPFQQQSGMLLYIFLSIRLFAFTHTPPAVTQFLGAPSTGFPVRCPLAPLPPTFCLSHQGFPSRLPPPGLLPP